MASSSGVVRSAFVSKRGGPEVLAVTDRPLPPLGVNDVGVDVEVSGVAFGDVMLREGLRAGEVPLPAVPGYDVAGVVSAVGPEVADVRVGDRVVAWTSGSGGNADRVIVPGWSVVARPEGVRPEQATALVLNYLTAMQLLTRASGVRAGDSVLVHGGGGGVGSALLQLARVRGLRVWATGGPGQQDLIRSLGATPVDYTRQDVAQVLKAQAAGGVEAVFDPIGGPSWKAGYELLSPGGKLVLYGISGGTRGGRRSLGGLVRVLARAPRTSWIDYPRRGVGVVGYNSSLTVPAHRQWYRDDLTELLGMLAAHMIDPLIDEVLPLTEVRRAHERLGAGGVHGKIVLRHR